MNKTKTLISVAIFLFFLLFAPLLWRSKTVLDYYAGAPESEFVSNLATVRAPAFAAKTELFILSEDLFNCKIVVFYQANNYRNLERASIADYFYLQRKWLLFWEVVRYESSYMPYYENSEESFEQSAAAFKADVLGGKYSKGITATEERAITSGSQPLPTFIPGQALQKISSPDESQTVEIIAGELYGQNSLKLQGNSSELEIKNISQVVWSTNSKLLVYTPGDYSAALGTITGNGEIWTLDLQGQKRKIWQTSDFPNDFNCYSNGQIVIFGSKNQVGLIKLDDLSSRILLEFPALITGSEEFALPQFIAMDSDYVYLNLPQASSGQNINFAEYRILINSGQVEKL